MVRGRVAVLDTPSCRRVRDAHLGALGLASDEDAVTVTAVAVVRLARGIADDVEVKFQLGAGWDRLGICRRWRRHCHEENRAEERHKSSGKTISNLGVAHDCAPLGVDPSGGCRSDEPDSHGRR